MGTALTGNTISSSYLGLIKTTDSAAISSSAKRLTDGAGNDSVLFLSTTSLGVNVTPTDTLHVDGTFRLTGAFKDTTGDTGSSGQILSSTGSGTNWIDNDVGDITSVVAGDGLTGGGTSGAVTINAGAGNLIDVQADQIDVDLSELTTSTSDADGDFFAVVDSANAQKKLTKGNINLSGFNNDLSIPTVSGTTNKIAKFTASTTVGDSVITEVSSEIGINIASPQEILHQHIGSSSTNYHQFTNSTTGSAVNNGLLVGINSAGEAQILNKLNSANAKIRLATYAGTTIMDLNGNIEADNGSNGDQYLRISNNDSGTAAQSTIYVSNSGANADGLFAGSLGTSFTTDSGFVQDGAAIGSGTGASGGLSIMTRAAADMRFYTNGHTNERMRITSGGNVGIGTTSPTSGMRLDVHGGDFRVGDDANQGLEGGYSSGAGVAYLQGYNRGTSAFIDLLLNNNVTITSGGNVKLGSSTTGTPAVNADDLVIDKGATESGITIVSTSAGSLRFGDAANTSIGYIEYGHSSNAMSFGVNGATAGAFVGKALGVGHGTADNSGTGGIHIEAASSTDQLILEATGSGTAKWYLGARSNNLYFVDVVAASTRFFLDSSGNAGLGTTSPTSVAGYSVLEINHATNGGILDLSQGDTMRGRLVATTSSLSIETSGTIPINFFVNGSTRMTIVSDGRVGISKTPTSTYNSTLQIETHDGSNVLELNQTATTNRYFAIFTNPNGAIGSIQGSGTTTSYVTSSDYRLKENVVEMTGALDRVNQLKPSRFNFISDADKTLDGFLAHEVQDIVPEAITGEKDATDKDGNPEYQGIDQSKLVPLLVGAIQELKAEIDELKKK